MREYLFTTKRLGFYPWQEGDFPLAKSLWGNPKVTRLISASGRFADEEIAQRLQTEIQNQEQYGVQYWQLWDRQLDTFVGCCGLRPAPEPETMEMGFHLLPEHWGKHYGFDGATAVIGYGFGVLKLRVLVAGHHPDNAASAGLLRKLGFLPTGKEHYRPTGLMHHTYRLEMGNKTGLFTEN